MAALKPSVEVEIPEVQTMKKNMRPALRAVISVAAALVILLAGTLAAYAADLGGFRETVQLWLRGELKEVEVSHSDDYYEFQDADWNWRVTDYTLDDDGNRRPLTVEEAMEAINENPCVVAKDDRLLLFFRGESRDITEAILADGKAEAEFTDEKGEPRHYRVTQLSEHEFEIRGWRTFEDVKDSGYYRVEIPLADGKTLPVIFTDRWKDADGSVKTLSTDELAEMLENSIVIGPGEDGRMELIFQGEKYPLPEPFDVGDEASFAYIGRSGETETLWVSRLSENEYRFDTTENRRRIQAPIEIRSEDVHTFYQPTAEEWSMSEQTRMETVPVIFRDETGALCLTAAGETRKIGEFAEGEARRIETASGTFRVERKVEQDYWVNRVTD